MTRVKSIHCNEFRGSLYHFQADEVPEELRRRLQEHLDGCEPCARLLAVENSFLDALRGRLRPETAPPALRARVRRALEREAPPPGAGGLWRRLWAPGTSALAAAMLMAAVLAPVLVDLPGDVRGIGGNVVHVIRTVTIVDFQCDQGGRTLREQAGCLNAHHVNALKLANGAYWNLSLAQDMARGIVFDPALRGRRVVVQGDLYPALSTVFLSDLRDSVPIGL